MNLKDKNSIYIDFLITLKDQPDAILFLFETTIEECRNLQELASENNNCYITFKDILDLDKCIDFFKCLGTLNELPNKSDREIINLLTKKVDERPEILINLKNFVSNYNQIKILLTSLDKSEALRNKIHELLNNSEILLSNTKPITFFCTLKKNKNDENLTKEKLIELRERAQLSKNIICYGCYYTFTNRWD